MADFGKQGKPKAGGGTATTPPQEHGMSKGGSAAASGMFGPTAPVHRGGVGNNDKNKAK